MSVFAFVRNADIQQRVTFADLRNNSNNVSPMGHGAGGSYNQSQMQDLINKVDELINALRSRPCRSIVRDNGVTR